MKAVNYGIDLGTTNSLIAKYENGKVIVFRNPIGHKEALPSVVGFRKDRTLIGDKAKELISKDPVNVFGNFKRKMGTDEKYYVVNLDENITPIDLSTFVLNELKSFIQATELPEAMVITIPASFDSMQSNATQTSGINAGFKDVFLLQEPIAASLAYFNECNQQDNPDGHWLVYDLGGGTFDVALIRIEDGQMSIVDHDGNNFLGGIDFDYLLIEQLLIPQLEAQSNTSDLLAKFQEINSPYEKLYNQIIYKAEEAKKELSNQDATEIEIDFNDETYYITITQSDYEQVIAPKIDSTIQTLNNVLKRNNITTQAIQQIVLVGGSTYSPYVRKRLQEATQIFINTQVDPTTAIAVGAAYYAANKHYTPQTKIALQNGSTFSVDEFIQDVIKDEYQEAFQDWDVVASYAKMSKDNEELILVKMNNGQQPFQYRIQRQDGGFDTGIMQGKNKFTEFVPLMEQAMNTFTLKIYDAQHREINHLAQTITISQGFYNIDGQPLPKDICLEVDDLDNNTTKLEVVFERNSIIPQKKTLYREASSTIRKGAPENLVINILEGDKLARPISNLPIGYIQINGKDLSSDLIKGSDIEITISITESRILSTEVYLVMTDQKFENTFNITQRVINTQRLIQQYFELEEELRDTCKNMQHYEDNDWLPQVEHLYNELTKYQDDIQHLDKELKSDKKYIIADVVSRISKEFDQIGGKDRLQQLRDTYLNWKSNIEEGIQNVDFDKDKLVQSYESLSKQDAAYLKTQNASTLEKGIDKLYDFYLHVMHSNVAYLLSQLNQLKYDNYDDFNNKSEIERMIARTEDIVAKNSYKDLRTSIYNIYFLINQNYGNIKYKNEPYKGTGLG